MDMIKHANEQKSLLEASPQARNFAAESVQKQTGTPLD